MFALTSGSTIMFILEEKGEVECPFDRFRLVVNVDVTPLFWFEVVRLNVLEIVYPVSPVPPPPIGVVTAESPSPKL